MAYNDCDYVVLIDENGQPYIAHGFFKAATGKVKQGAKYLMKAIDTRTGLPVYAYTAAEVRRLQGMGREAKKAVAKASNKVGWAARGAGADIRRITGIGGKKRAEELQSRADSTTNRSKSAFERQAANARAEYSNSILGRLENVVERLRQRGKVAKDTIRQYGSTTLAEIREGAGAVGNAIKTGATNAGNAIKTGATNAGNAIKTGAANIGNAAANTYNNVKGSAEERRAFRQARSEYDAAVEALDNATTKKEHNAAMMELNRVRLNLENQGYTPEDFGRKTWY